MTDDILGIVLFLIQIATFLFYCGVLIFVLVKTTDRRRARRLAAVAITVLILSQLLRLGGNFGVVRLVPVDDVALVLSMQSIVLSLLHAVVICLLIAAAFAGDEPAIGEATGGSVKSAHENPYAAPSST